MAVIIFKTVAILAFQSFLLKLIELVLNRFKVYFLTAQNKALLELNQENKQVGILPSYLSLREHLSSFCFYEMDNYPSS